SRSSSLPGCSPTMRTRALGRPSPKTVWVPFRYRSQLVHARAASRSTFSSVVADIPERGRRGWRLGDDARQTRVDDALVCRDQAQVVDAGSRYDGAIHGIAHAVAQ